MYTFLSSDSSSGSRLSDSSFSDPVPEDQGIARNNICSNAVLGVQDGEGRPPPINRVGLMWLNLQKPDQDTKEVGGGVKDAQEKDSG